MQKEVKQLVDEQLGSRLEEAQSSVDHLDTEVNNANEQSAI